jgi:DNA replication protein DnaC
VKKIIVGDCSLCGGEGYKHTDKVDSETMGQDVKLCHCAKLWKFRLAQMKANIPKEFWDVENMTVMANQECFDLIQKYVDHIENAFENGLGFLMIGENGVGKTTAATMILAKAIRAGHTAFYTTLSDLVDAFYKSVKDDWVVEKLAELLDVDFLVLDEMDKAHMKSGSTFLQSKLDSILRQRRATVKSTTVISNMTQSELNDLFGASVMSILSSRHKQIRFVPGDYRKDQSHQWSKLLEGTE